MTTSAKATTLPSSIALAHGGGEQSIADATASLATLTTCIEHGTTRDDAKLSEATAATQEKRARAQGVKDSWCHSLNRLARGCGRACMCLIVVLIGMIVAALGLGIVVAYGFMLYVLVPDEEVGGGSWILFAFFVAPPVLACLTLLLTVLGACCGE